jgi:membrane associated rhomboid family serine protease
MYALLVLVYNLAINMGTWISRQFSSFGNSHSRAKLIAIITVLASVIQGLLSQSSSTTLLFSPFRTLFRLEVWRPFTSLFIAVSPIEVIFGALIIYSIGGLLESRWSQKRFVTIALGIPLLANVLVLFLTVLFPATLAPYVYAGTRQVIATLWITLGLLSHFSHETLNFWGTPVRGKTFALIGVGFVLLSGVFGGFIPVLPELCSALLCYLYMYRHRIFRIKNQLQLAFYERQLKKLKKQTNLRVIKGSRSDSRIRERDDDSEDGDNGGGSGPQIH